MAEANNRRSNRTILSFLIAACSLLCVLCAGAGYYFSNTFISSGVILPPDLAENPPVWLPILVSFGMVILTGWGAAIAHMGITSSLMTGRTTGEIIESRIDTYYDSDEGGDIYLIISAVCYTANGHRYENEGRHDFTSADRDEALGKLESIKPGDPVSVIYDPGNPSSMTLNSPDINPLGETLAGLGLIAGGLLLSLLLGVMLSRLL